MGFCSARRLEWPPGTVLFELAGAEVHAVAAAALKAAGVRVPRACLLRRVAADVRLGEGLATAAGVAGLRGDRLSAWVLQARPLFYTIVTSTSTGPSRDTNSASNELVVTL